MHQTLACVLVIFAPLVGLAQGPTSLDGIELTHGFVDSSGARIHYVTAGDGPLVVLMHGFPDYWYSWRHQIPKLAGEHRVVAIDLRGYNRSDQPTAVDEYSMKALVADLISVIDHFGAERASVVGHDWGAAIAWNVAMTHPERIERLVTLSLPHPSGFFREIASNEAQQAASGYARVFQSDGAADRMTPESLANRIGDPDTRKAYVAAFERSSLEGMLSYYKANYPVAQKASTRNPSASPKPGRVACPVLAFHGLEDKYILASGYNSNWDWIDANCTFVMLPNAGHFLHQEQHELVTQRLLSWLRDTSEAS